MGILPIVSKDSGYIIFKSSMSLTILWPWNECGAMLEAAFLICFLAMMCIFDGI